MNDAELYNDGACGSDAECLLSPSTPHILTGTEAGESAAITIGHTVVFPAEAVITERWVAHEVEGHVAQYENRGALPFGVAYGTVSLFHWVANDPDPYYNNYFEWEARTHEQ